jgi:hypothetical protein
MDLVVQDDISHSASSHGGHTPTFGPLDQRFGHPPIMTVQADLSDHPHDPSGIGTSSAPAAPDSAGLTSGLRMELAMLLRPGEPAPAWPPIRTRRTRPHPLERERYQRVRSRTPETSR